jgi:hypothetical protein
MAHILEDRVLETSTSVSTTAFVVAGALTGFRTFGSVMVVGDTCWYYIEGVDGSGNATGEFETGIGIYSATNTITRDAVSRSSNANSLVNFSAGTKRVGITLIGEDNMARSHVVAYASGNVAQ